MHPELRNGRSLGDIAELMLADLEPLGGEMDAAVVEAAARPRRRPGDRGGVSAQQPRQPPPVADRAGAPATAGRRRATCPPRRWTSRARSCAAGSTSRRCLHGYRRGQNSRGSAGWGTPRASSPAGPELVQVLERSLAAAVRLRRPGARPRDRRGAARARGGARRRARPAHRDGPPDPRRRPGRRGRRASGSATSSPAATPRSSLWAEPRGDVPGRAGIRGDDPGPGRRRRRPLTFPPGRRRCGRGSGTRRRPRAERAARGVELRRTPTSASPSARRGRDHRASGAATTPRSASSGCSPATRRGERLALYRELEVIALAAQDPDRAAEFVAATLGPARRRRSRARRACARRCASSSTRPTTRPAPPRACTPTATPSCSASRARPSCSATARASAGSSSRWRSSSPTNSARGC